MYLAGRFDKWRQIEYEARFAHLVLNFVDK